MAVKKPKHYHELERSKLNKFTYRCVATECHFFGRREFLIGKKSICPKCKDLFVLSDSQLKNKIPVCEGCSRSPKARDFNIAKAVSESILNELATQKEKEAEAAEMESGKIPISGA